MRRAPPAPMLGTPGMEQPVPSLDLPAVVSSWRRQQQCSRISRQEPLLASCSSTGYMYQTTRSVRWAGRCTVGHVWLLGQQGGACRFTSCLPAPPARWLCVLCVCVLLLPRVVLLFCLAHIPAICMSVFSCSCQYAVAVASLRVGNRLCHPASDSMCIGACTSPSHTV